MKAGGKKNLAADAQSGKVGKVLSVQDSESCLPSLMRVMLESDRFGLV